MCMHITHSHFYVDYYDKDYLRLILVSNTVMLLIMCKRP